MDINRRNIEKYEASKQNTAKGQEDTYQAQQGGTDNGGQSKQIQNKCPHLGDLIPTQEEQEELEEGDNLLGNQMGIRIRPR